MPLRSVTSALKTVVVARRSRLQQVGIGVVLATVFTVVRWHIDGGRLGLQFASCFPAVVIASVLLDPVFVVLVALGAIAFAQWLLLGEPWFDPPDLAHISVALYFALSVAAITAIGAGLRVALAEADSLSAQKDILNAELRDRIRTGFGLIGTMVGDGDPDDTDAAKPGRALAALAGASELLGPRLTQRRSMSEIVKLALAPFGCSDRVTAAGPPVELPGPTSIAVALALHEMATNALHRGALSNDAGMIDIRWKSDGKRRFVVIWQERDVPLIGLMERDSFGADLLIGIAGIIDVERSFHAHGFRCEIVIAQNGESSARAVARGA